MQSRFEESGCGSTPEPMSGGREPQAPGPGGEWWGTKGRREGDDENRQGIAGGRGT